MNDGRTGNSFHLSGDLDPWQGIVLALVAAGLAWWLYRMETSKGTAAPLDKLLPLLRAAAVALIVLTLVGPTIRSIEEEGQRGRVLVFLDASQSMSIKDDHISPGRKLLLAERHGWLPKDQNLLDPALQDAADLLAEARINLTDGLEDPAADLTQLRKEFAKSAKQAADLLDGKNYEVPASMDRKGVLHHQVWNGINGTTVNDLRNQARFREGKPDDSNYLKSAESPVNVGDNFGRRIYAKIIPPETGEYRFWAYSDDECAVYLNNAGINPENAREILRINSAGTRDWSEDRRSRAITLSQGKAYYFEILHKESSGDDYCAVGWTLPSGRLERPIPGNHFRAPNSETAPTFSELREGMRAEVVKIAESLKKGSGEAAETTLRDKLNELAETVLSYESSFRSTFELYAENLATSDNESIRAALADFDATGRWSRATRLLTKREDSILKELSDTHVIEVRALNGQEAEPLWDNRGAGELPEDFGPSAETRRTDIATGLRSTVKADDEDETFIKSEDGKQPRSAAVILTDGLHNEGASPFETAKLLAGRDLPIHAIGLGSDNAPPDLAVLEVETPTKVLKDDRLRGSVSLKDNLPFGTAFKLVVTDEQGEQVWEKELVGMNALRRRVDFDFPMEKLVEDKLSGLGLDKSVERNSIPFRMKIRVEPVKGEVRDDNNERSFAFDAITKKNSMLIVDGRPRWETRYLRNLFERDERWSATAVFAGPASDDGSLPRGEEGDVFPTEKKALFAYDLLVLGEIGKDLLKEEELEWIRDFVANRGGGIILLDGARQRFREFALDDENPIASLLPVKWPEEEGPKRLSPHALRITQQGKKNPALFLHPSEERNEELWGYLPKPGWVAPTEALPGAEVHLEATLDEEGEEAVPLLVSRPVGAGKALYAGFDGTWRWRFEVADKYHQRYWHQIASWIMEQPFAVSDDFVAIDPGASTYRPGETADLRVRVRDRDGKPLDDPDAVVEALVWRDNKVVATVPMETNSESGGLFRGETPALSPGQHVVTLRVSGYGENELRSNVEFLVEEAESPELATLTCNEELLREVAELSGGRFLREEQIGRLNDLLKPISSGKLITTEIALWQSYWWFIPIVLLLGLELFLRKRAGML